MDEKVREIELAFDSIPEGIPKNMVRILLSRLEEKEKRIEELEEEIKRRKEEA